MNANDALYIVEHGQSRHQAHGCVLYWAFQFTGFLCAPRGGTHLNDPLTICDMVISEEGQEGADRGRGSDLWPNQRLPLCTTPFSVATEIKMGPEMDRVKRCRTTEREKTSKLISSPRDMTTKYIYYRTI